MITTSTFGKLKTGETVTAYTLNSACGISVTILDRGGTIQSIKMPDKNGNVKDIVCGYDTPDGYADNDGYQGALIGRYANRIKNGTFTLGGKTYTLPKNEKGVCTLHGGNEGFDRKFWKVEAGKCPSGADRLKLFYTSEDGEEGFPGKVDVTVVYRLTDDGEFTIRYKAKADKDTPIAMTNHAYFNLAGYETQDVKNNVLKLNCSNIVAIDKDLIPTSLMDVTGTAFDFRNAKKIGKDIGGDHEQLKLAGGYDHTFVIDQKDGKEWKHGVTLYEAAVLRDPESGRKLTLSTDAPGLQVYSGNFMGGGVIFKNGVEAKKQGAVCLETGFYPDTPNRPDFPSCIYGPDRDYECTAVFRFEIEK